jgi:hypothetical protein
VFGVFILNIQYAVPNDKYKKMQTIHIIQEFNAPQQEIFDYLSNHNNLGALFLLKVKKIKDAEGSNKNGLGSVRSLGIGIPLLQETITQFDEPHLIEYKISNNAPVKYHLGTMKFYTQNNKTVLDYTIQLESKFAFADPVIKFALEKAIRNGLKKLASKYR